MHLLLAPRRSHLSMRVQCVFVCVRLCAFKMSTVDFLGAETPLLDSLMPWFSCRLIQACLCVCVSMCFSGRHPFQLGVSEGKPKGRPPSVSTFWVFHFMTCLVGLWFSIRETHRETLGLWTSISTVVLSWLLIMSLGCANRKDASDFSQQLEPRFL